MCWLGSFIWFDRLSQYLITRRASITIRHEKRRLWNNTLISTGVSQMGILLMVWERPFLHQSFEAVNFFICTASILNLRPNSKQFIIVKVTLSFHFLEFLEDFVRVWILTNLSYCEWTFTSLWKLITLSLLLNYQLGSWGFIIFCLLRCLLSWFFTCTKIEFLS